MIQTTLRLEDNQHKQLKQKAKEEYSSVNSLIKRIIDEWFEANK